MSESPEGVGDSKLVRRKSIENVHMRGRLLDPLIARLEA
jgi:hypothetical protein